MTLEHDVSTPVTKALNTILELELAGVVRYTHYALMVFGYNRIPIVSWLRGQAAESLGHADKAGDILRESLAHETVSLNAYKALLKLVEGDSVMLEEYAREMIYQEELHLGEVDKMLRKPGEIAKFQG